MFRFLIIVLFTITSASANNKDIDTCTITMGYKVKIKEPFILKDGSGLYKDLYSKAADMIGCKLNIIREPKKRIIAKIKSGTIDFYPGFSINDKRAKFAYYIKNGLSKGTIGVSKNSVESIIYLKDIKTLNLTVLREKGGADKFKEYNLKTLDISDLSIKKALIFLQRDRADFYIGDKSNIEYYFKKYDPQNLKLHFLKTKEKVWYAGFGKKSKHTTELINSSYDKTKKITYENYPIVLDKSCITYKFQVALKKLKDDGYTDKLYNKYFR